MKKEKESTIEMLANYCQKEMVETSTNELHNYRFAYDLCKCMFDQNNIEQIKAKIDEYINKISSTIKNNKYAYCAITKAFNVCCWGCYEFAIDNEIGKLFSEYYLKFMYDETTAYNYVSDDDWGYVQLYLD